MPASFRAFSDAGGVQVVDLLHLGVPLPRDLVEGLAVEAHGHRAHLDEGRLELRQRGRVGLRPRELLAIEGELAGDRIGHGDEALLEAVLLDGAGRVLLRAQGQAVEVLALVPFEGGDQVGADALRDLEDLAAQDLVVAVDAAAVGADRAARHALHAAADHQLLLAAEHPHRREVHRLQARAAEAVQGDAGDLLGPAGGEERVLREVRPLVVGLADAPHDHVVDVGLLQPGAGGERVQRLGEELLGVDAAQGPLAGPAAAARGAHCVEDEGVGHGEAPVRLENVVSGFISAGGAGNKRGTVEGSPVMSRLLVWKVNGAVGMENTELLAFQSLEACSPARSTSPRRAAR